MQLFRTLVFALRCLQCGNTTSGRWSRRLTSGSACWSGPRGSCTGSQLCGGGPRAQQPLVGSRLPQALESGRCPFQTLRKRLNSVGQNTSKSESGLNLLMDSLHLKIPTYSQVLNLRLTLRSVSHPEPPSESAPRPTLDAHSLVRSRCSHQRLLPWERVLTWRTLTPRSRYEFKSRVRFTSSKTRAEMKQTTVGIVTFS